MRAVSSGICPERSICGSMRRLHASRVILHHIGAKQATYVPTSLARLAASSVLLPAKAKLMLVESYHVPAAKQAMTHGSQDYNRRRYRDCFSSHLRRGLRVTWL